MQIHSTTLGLKNKTNNGIKLFFFFWGKRQKLIYYIQIHSTALGLKNKTNKEVKYKM